MIKIEKNVAEIIKILERGGHEAFAVGGCVRDSFLERTPHDWDITTSALPWQVKELFKRTVDTGLKHGTVTVLYGGGSYEITTYRVDGAYSDSRRPDTVTFTTSLEEDLRRRDFTINAMAYNPGTGIVDPFGGAEDLRRGVVRAVGSPSERFSEDALRIMRAFRFSAKFGFTIEPETLKAAAELSENLSAVSAERISAELEKILLSDHPEVLADMYRAGVTKMFIPEFDTCMETPQNNPHHKYDVGTHSVFVVKNIRRDKVIRLAALLHDFGKPVVRETDDKGIDHFVDHPEESAKMAKNILQRLRFDNVTIKKVVTLVRYHELQLRKSPYRIRKFLSEVGPEMFPLLLELRRADILAQSEYQRKQKEKGVREFEMLYENIVENGECLSLKELAVNGNDLMEEGIPKGTEIGRILGLMLEDVLQNPEHNDKNYLIRHYTGKMELVGEFAKDPDSAADGGTYYTFFIRNGESVDVKVKPDGAYLVLQCAEDGFEVYDPEKGTESGVRNLIKREKRMLEKEVNKLQKTGAGG